MKKFILFFITAVAFSQSPTDLAGIKICIDPGHGGHNAANDRHVVPDVGSDFWESESNFQKALLLRPLLQARGATVFLTRETNDYPTDVDPTLTQRWQFANANNVTWFHSIHSNALGAANSGTNYTLVLVKENISTRQPAFPQDVTMANLIYNNIRARNRTSSWGGNILPGVALDYTFYGGPNGGFNLGVMNGLTMPGELSEGSFHDFYPETRRLLNNDYRKSEAYGIYNGFLEYFNVPFDTLGIICGTQKNGSTPINNIAVRLMPVNKLYTGDAFNNGYFLFDSLAPGNYQVIFETQGYSKDTVNVVLLASTKKVDSVFPANRATGISRTSNIVITFLKPVDTTVVKSAFSISPSVPGTIVWNAERTVLTFIPSGKYLYKKDYTVTIAGYGESRQPSVFVDNTTVTSNVGVANFGTTFQTEQLPPYLTLTQPKPNDTAFVVTKQIGFKFSVSMDTASVRSAFLIVPAVSGSMDWSQNNTVLLFTADHPLPYNTNFTVTMGGAAKSIYGVEFDANKDSIGGDPYVLTFKTQSDPTSVEDEARSPLTYKLSQNYPNPFNPSTTIYFEIPEKQRVVLKVFDIVGREVATLVDAELNAGRYSKVFDASRLSSGMYFYRIGTTNYREVKKMMLMK
ncbi:MAG: N-acetylmuramoyl-L-alanine amidase [Bacteroidota bacterium]